MAHKVHLQANKGATRAPMAMCSTNLINVDPATGRGKVRDNGRRSYVRMGSPVVSLAEFATKPHGDLCAHCCAEMLIRQNLRRKAAGLPLFTSYQEILEKKLAES